MFLYSFKINSQRLIKFLFILMLIFILILFSFGIYKIFFSNEKTQAENEPLTLNDALNTNKVFEITSQNYTNILQAVNNDIDSYVGCKVHFVGYIYRLIDFSDSQFVLARDMLVDENTRQTLVVGFLCVYDKASNFKDNTWVDVTGTITKGDFHGNIAQINVLSISECNIPEDKYVNQPDNTYIPTNNML